MPVGDAGAVGVAVDGEVAGAALLEADDEALVSAGAFAASADGVAAGAGVGAGAGVLEVVGALVVLDVAAGF